jgi:hypothetical protein
MPLDRYNKNIMMIGHRLKEKRTKAASSNHFLIVTRDLINE